MCYDLCHLHSPGGDVGVVDGLGGGAAVPGVHLLPHLAIYVDIAT